MDIYTYAGLAGVLSYVLSYSLLQLGLLDGNGLRYSVANVGAAALVLVSLTNDFNLASAIIQVVWIVVGLTGLALRFSRMFKPPATGALELGLSDQTTQQDATAVPGA